MWYIRATIRSICSYHMKNITILNYQKVPMVATTCSYSKEGGLYWLKVSIRVNSKPLLLATNMGKSSKSEWLLNKWCSFMPESLSSLSFFSSNNRNFKVLPNSDFTMALTFGIMGSITSTTLELINNART